MQLRVKNEREGKGEKIDREKKTSYMSEQRWGYENSGVKLVDRIIEQLRARIYFPSCLEKSSQEMEYNGAGGGIHLPCIILVCI